MHINLIVKTNWVIAMETKLVISPFLLVWVFLIMLEFFSRMFFLASKKKHNVSVIFEIKLQRNKHRFEYWMKGSKQQVYDR